jgi:hypothetical protein
MKASARAAITVSTGSRKRLHILKTQRAAIEPLLFTVEPAYRCFCPAGSSDEMDRYAGYARRETAEIHRIARAGTPKKKKSRPDEARERAEGGRAGGQPLSRA